jgi:hypothetical protein
MLHKHLHRKHGLYFKDFTDVQRTCMFTSYIIVHVCVSAGAAHVEKKSFFCGNTKAPRLSALTE